MFGGNIANTANGEGETAISIHNVANLKPKWVVTTTGDVSARAAVVGGKVYFPDWGGSLWALNAATGKILWKFDSGASVILGAAISGGVVYWGSGYSHFGPPHTGNNKFYAFSVGGK
jgi:polyvinyl alcohol dehydrogenase (cytochrome)